MQGLSDIVLVFAITHKLQTRTTNILKEPCIGFMA